MGQTTWIALSLVGALLFGGVPSKIVLADAAPVKRELQTRQIKIKTVDGALFHANLGYIEVPENRQVPTSNTLKVAFMQILSPAREKGPTVFHFHGGPDDAAHLAQKIAPEVMADLTSTQDITIDFSFRSRGYREYLDFADVVIMDDRGMGLSRPRLTCPENPAPVDFFKPETEQKNTISKTLKSCLAHFEQKGHDLSGYNLNEIAADFNDIRRSLGYDKVVLQGTSFGSQTAFTIMQKYPEHVARAYLTGVEGMADTYDLPSEVHTATKAFIRHANANPDVREQLPREDMGYTLRTIFTRLKEKPTTLTIETPDGKSQTLLLDNRTVSQLLLSLGTLRYRGDTPDLGSAGASETIPLILALYYEAYDGLAAILSKRLHAASDDTVTNAAALAIDCASGLSKARRSQFTRYPSTIPESAMFLPLGYEGLTPGLPDYFCSTLNIPDMGDIWRTEKTSEIPALFYHGDFDGTTPPENAQRAIKRFPNGKLVMVEGAAHYKLEMEYLSQQLKDIRTEFIKSGKLPENMPAIVKLPPIEFEILPAPALWGFKLGLGNLVLRFGN